MRKHVLRLLLCSMLVLWGCAKPAVVQTTADGITCSVEFASALVANASVPATVRFTQDGQTVTLTDVALDLQMPGMTMGSNRPLAQPQTDGSHTTDVLFTMDGEWVVVVTGRLGTEEKRFVLQGIVVRP